MEPLSTITKPIASFKARIRDLNRLIGKELLLLTRRSAHSRRVGELALVTFLLASGIFLLPRETSLIATVLILGGYFILSRSLIRNIAEGLSAVHEQELNTTIQSLYKDRKVLSEQLDEMATIREVGLTVNSILDFDEMVTSILDLTTNSLDAAKALLYMRNQDEDEYEIVGARIGGQDVDLARIVHPKVKLNEGIVGRAVAQRCELVSAHPKKGLAVAIPLQVKDRIVGVLKIFDPDHSDLSSERRRKLHAIAAAVAVAVENARLYKLAVTDGLTGLFVHRHFQHRLEEEFNRSVRHGAPLALLLTDIDHFKVFNDTHGHQTGDVVLKAVSDILADEARNSDVVCRYGGEEMALVCVQTGAVGAVQLAERIRSRIESTSFRDADDQKDLSVTISIGVSVFSPGMKNRMEMIQEADDALYRAKDAGRNRVELAGEELPAVVG